VNRRLRCTAGLDGAAGERDGPWDSISGRSDASIDERRDATAETTRERGPTGGAAEMTPRDRR